MARDLTRDDLRTIVRKGLERTSGNYKVMVELFNMPADDYKTLLGFSAGLPVPHAVSGSPGRPPPAVTRDGRANLHRRQGVSPPQPEKRLRPHGLVGRLRLDIFYRFSREA